MLKFVFVARTGFIVSSTQKGNSSRERSIREHKTKVHGPYLLALHSWYYWHSVCTAWVSFFESLCSLASKGGTDEWRSENDSTAGDIYKWMIVCYGVAKPLYCFYVLLHLEGTCPTRVASVIISTNISQYRVRGMAPQIDDKKNETLRVYRHNLLDNYQNEQGG